MGMAHTNQSIKKTRESEMKTWEELSFEEKANLTEDEVRKEIRLVAVNEGVRLPVDVEMTAPKPVPIQPSVTVYEVAGREYIDEQAAKRVLEVLRQEHQYAVSLDYDYSYSEKYISERDLSMPTIESKLVYDAETYMKASSMLKEYKEKKNTYDKLVKEFKDAEKAIGYIASRVWDEYWKAKTKVQKKNQMDAAWSEYCQAISEPRKAATLFHKAYGKEDIDLVSAVMGDALKLVSESSCDQQPVN